MFKLLIAVCCCAFLAVEAIPEKEAMAAANALLELSVAINDYCQSIGGCRRRDLPLPNIPNIDLNAAVPNPVDLVSTLMPQAGRRAFALHTTVAQNPAYIASF